MCSLQGCPGGYEARRIVHTIRHQDKVLVIDHVPAEVCTVCSDVLLEPETVRRLEALLGSAARPAGTAPVYEYV